MKLQRNLGGEENKILSGRWKKKKIIIIFEDHIKGAIASEETWYGTNESALALLFLPLSNYFLALIVLLDSVNSILLFFQIFIIVLPSSKQSLSTILA